MAKVGKEQVTYNELVHAHADGLYRFAFRLCGNRDTAEDLVQEAFCEAWRSIHSLRQADKGRSWLFQILRHRYLHWVRDSARKPQPKISLEDAQHDSSLTVPNGGAELDRQETLQAALGDLDDRYKEPFLMVFLEGQSCKEAATALKIPLGTILSRIHRARSLLRGLLERAERRADGDGGRPRSRGNGDQTNIAPFQQGTGS